MKEKGKLNLLKALRNDKKSFLLIVVSLLIVIIGSTYSMSKWTFIGEENTLQTSSSPVSVEFLEGNDIINLNDALPMPDNEGIAQDEAFEFQVKTTNSRAIDMGYNIEIKKLETALGYTPLSDSDMKVYLEDGEGNVLVEPTLISELDNYVLLTGGHIHNNENQVVINKYKLRVWINKTKDATTWTEITKLQYKFRINVKTINESQKPKYQIAYNSNTGTGTMDNQTVLIGTKKVLSANAFTKEGYIFKGWSTTANGEVEYQDKEVVQDIGTNNQTVTLYAVWEEIINYQVRYNGNGGIVPTVLPITDETNHWTNGNNIYKSGNYHISSSTSSIRSESFTLTETGTLSFDWAVSSESASYDYLYYTLYKDGSTTALTGTGTSTKIGGNSSITDESNLVYNTVTKELEPGSYILEFSYKKDSSADKGLDRGYVKNIVIPEEIDTMPNSNHTNEISSTLSKNEYKKEHYSFAGWSTTLNGEVEYQDEKVLSEPLTNIDGDVIDLYAVWGPVKYKVKVVAQNGIVTSNAEQNITYNTNGTFTVNPNNSTAMGTVTCTNNQTATITDTTLTVQNVLRDTTCTVTFATELTVLYEDGTFIINELTVNRQANIEEHGQITKSYNPMSESNIYIFNYDFTRPWDSDKDSITRVEIGKKITPVSTKYWFFSFNNMSSAELNNLDTSQVTNMSNMFSFAGYKSTTFDIGDLSNWDTSQVTNMNYMFGKAGYKSTTFDIGNLSSWDTSKVTDMSYMFSYTGKEATTWDIGNLSNWDTSQVTDTSYMFNGAGYTTTTFDIGNLSSWDTSKVTDMSYMFNYAGYTTTTFDIGDLSSWNTSQVTNMEGMFANAGYKCTAWNIDLSSWNTSKVTKMSDMFYYTGKEATTWDIGNLSTWDTSQVTGMSYMFAYADYNSTTFDIGNLSSWDTSKVIYITNMFAYAGYNATTFDIDLSNWNTSQVNSMWGMFSNAGNNATTWDIGDLSNWNTSKVTDMKNMFYETGQNATTWDIGDLSAWNTSKVIDMRNMFYRAGFNATTWNIGDLSTWDTSQVTDMGNMFTNAGYNATTFDIDLSNWDTSQVTDMSSMVSSAGHDSTTWDIGNLSTWNTSQVTDMSYMFFWSGQNATIFNSISTLNIPSGCNLDHFANSPNFKGTLVLNGTPSSYVEMLTSTSTSTGSRINLYYTDSASQTVVEELITSYGSSGTESQGNIYNMGQYTPTP